MIVQIKSSDLFYLTILDGNKLLAFRLSLISSPLRKDANIVVNKAVVTRFIFVRGKACEEKVTKFNLSRVIRLYSDIPLDKFSQWQQDTEYHFVMFILQWQNELRLSYPELNEIGFNFQPLAIPSQIGSSQKLQYRFAWTSKYSCLQVKKAS